MKKVTIKSQTEIKLLDTSLKISVALYTAETQRDFGCKDKLVSTKSSRILRITNTIKMKIRTDIVTEMVIVFLTKNMIMTKKSMIMQDNWSVNYRFTAGSA